MRVRFGGWIVGVAAAALLSASCTSSHHPPAQVLGRVIERDPTTTVTSAPATATSAPVTTPSDSSSTTTTTTATATAVAGPAPVTTQAPARPTTTAPTVTTSTTTTSTTATVLAGESLAPGAYLEQSDGSGFVTVDEGDKIGVVSLAPDVIEKPARTYRTHIDIEFEEQDVNARTLEPRITAFVENTSGRTIDLPGGFDLHLVCTRSDTPWLDLHVPDVSITQLAPGGTAAVSTTPVRLAGPGLYTCTGTLPIVLT